MPRKYATITCKKITKPEPQEWFAYFAYILHRSLLR